MANILVPRSLVNEADKRSALEIRRKNQDVCRRGSMVFPREDKLKATKWSAGSRP